MSFNVQVAVIVAAYLIFLVAGSLGAKAGKTNDCDWIGIEGEDLAQCLDKLRPIEIQIEMKRVLKGTHGYDMESEDGTD